MKSDYVFFIVVILLSIAAWFVIPNFLTKRAMRRVIKLFRDGNITSAQNAKTVDELRLKPQTFIQSIYMQRDYKPAALQILINADIIRQTKDGRLYLSKEKLALYDIGKGK